MKANLFLVAAPRSGSTQLARWLSSHPMVELSAIKEPNFFANHEFPKSLVRRNHLNDVNPTRFVHSRSNRSHQFAVFRRRRDYDALFSNMTAPWRLDASTTYLTCPEAPAAIRNYNPDARIILLTRDPLDRALSHYRLAVRTGRTNRSLNRELDDEANGITPLPARFLLRPSAFADGLQRFQRLFPPNQVTRLDYAMLSADPHSFVGAVCTFLQIDPARIDFTIKARNAGIAARWPRLNLLLTRSGAKTWLRRRISRQVKQRLAPLYFSPNTKIVIPPSHVARLRRHIQARS